MTRVKATTMAALAAIAAIGILLLAPTITGLSFAAAADSSSDSSGAAPDQSNNSNNGDSGSNKDKDKQTQVQGGPDYSGPGCEACPPKDPKPINPGPIVIQPVKVIVHHTTTTKTVHDRNLTVTQQNCIAGALNLGFSSNAQNRADATYGAILGCLA